MTVYNSIDEANFRQPDMGEYYNEDLMEELLHSIEPNNAKNAAYYVEEPFSTTLGYHEDYSAFVLKADPVTRQYDEKYKTSEGERNESINAIDADTIPFYLDSVSDGDMPFEINGEKYTSFKHYAREKMQFGSFKNKVFKIRTVGINAPEVPHLSLVAIKESDLKNKNVIKSFPTELIGKSPELIYLVNIERTKSAYDFIYNEDDHTWHEVFKSHDSYPYKYDNPNVTGVKYFTIVTEDEQTQFDMEGDTNLGLYATEIAMDLLNNAEDMRLILDAKQLYTSKKNSEIYQILQDGWNKDNSLWKITKSMWHRAFGDSIYKYAGFGTFGQDAYRRFLGAVYIKKSIDGKSVWINLAKYVKAKVGDAIKLMPGISPEAQANGNNLSDAFKVWSYDNSKSVIADGFYNISKSDFDDRRAIQKEITGLDFDTYRDYTVMIGDCLFMVPPTSIRVVNQINSTRVPILRSKGTAVKETPHNDRLIEMTLYFNGEEGINGIKVDKQLPIHSGTDENITYYMNGLRSLISMFKLTPFMPIENLYINNVLGIEAVSLANIQIQTMPMYPKCLAVSLTLQQFNYRIYLNELPLPSPEEGQTYSTNMFARTINYEVMRYYYQKPILAGEELKSLSANNQEFIEKTMGSSTALIPMEFKDQTINFMILDSDWLDKMKQVKELASKQPVNQTTPLNDATKKWAYQTGVSLGNLLDIFKGGIEVTPNENELNGYNYSTVGVIGATQLKSILVENLLNNNSSPLLSSITLLEKPYNQTIECVLEFSLLSLSQNEISNLMKKVMKELNTENQNLFAEGKLNLKLEKSISEGKIKWSLDKNTEEYEIAEFFAYRSGYGLSDIDIDFEDDWDMFASSSNEDTFEEIKEEALDTETLLSAKFIDYPIDNLIAQNFSIALGNVLSNTKLKIHEGYAPQYAGGQDTMVEFTMHTMDQSVVTALNSMQEMAAQQLIKYNSIIKCWPIRIVSEMTALCGIHEVIIDSIDISTVPMQPGLFAINCRAVSVDRTVRNKEALKKLDSINNGGATNPSSIGSLVEKTYFDLNNTLSQAEIYPDLELPTIEELSSKGFKFIRYMKNESNRKYVDPDFYFIYGYTYSSQMIRKSIVDYFEKNSTTGKAEIEKMSRQYFGEGSQQEYKVEYDSDNKKNILKYDAINKDLQEQYDKEKTEREKELLEARKQENKDNEDKIKSIVAIDNLYNKTKSCEEELSAMNLNAWDVCANIKCSLPEYVPLDNEDIIMELNNASDEIIKVIDSYLRKPIDVSKHKKSQLMTKGFNYKKYHDNVIYSAIKDTVKSLLNENKDGIWREIFTLINIDIDSSKIKNLMYGIFEAAAMAMSGNSEFAEGNDKDNYCSRAFFINSSIALKDSIDNTYPFSKMVDELTGEEFFAITNEMAIEKGLTFGPFQIRKYNKEFLESFYEDEAVGFGVMDFLDPYYNNSIHIKNFNRPIDEKELKEYKTKMIESHTYATEAFNRLVLVWVKKLIQDKCYISYYDIRRDDIYNTLDNLLKDLSGSVSKVVVKRGEEFVEKYAETPEAGIEVTEEVKEYTSKVKNIVSSYEDNLIAGKIFLPVICAVTHGDSSLYDKILSKNSGALNTKTRSCQIPFDSANDISDADRNFRKMIRGLAATKTKVMTGLDGIASEQTTKIENALIERNERLWLEAAEDPSLWVLHSFYDMIVHDKRGRMARAFPTYYMLLIDEGREIGYWKLHDNFYNMSSIHEIEVVKSRKIPADTARIVMTNLYKTFTTEDEDVKVDYEHNIKDVFNSIFSPSVYFEEEEAKRTNQSNLNRATIKPGVRIHLRMGYSGDAGNLPILFNGVVAEASTGELIELVAQGDGHEISNDQAFAAASTKDLSDLKNEDSFFAAKWIKNFLDEGATPKTLIKNMFTTKSGWIGKQINEYTNGRFFNDNMFGITHFGEIDYKTIHSDGEVMQNIYEAEGRMPWQDNPAVGSLAEGCADVLAPTFTVDISNKSVWDVLNICASSSLEFITGVAPFGLRSTVFFGRPHYYYAYDYIKRDDGIIVEKRKPYQQYHIIDSYSDIIGNSIIANGTNVKTVAVPTYKAPVTVSLTNKITEKKGTTLFADWDIYPEFQKTMIVNTGMTWKGNKLGSVIINSFMDKVSNDGGSKIAWRMGATALKNSFKDMYEGEVIIIGDTSIKPLDKVYLYDTYENMDGAFEVEAIVHKLSPETGFTSSVYPDCISTVDSRFEEISQMWTKQIAGQVIGTKTLIHLSNMLFGTTTKPMLNTIAKITEKGMTSSADMLKKAANLVGKEDLIKYCSTEKWTQNFFKALNISADEVTFWDTLDKLKNYVNISNSANAATLNSAHDVISQVKKLIDASDGSSVDDVVKSLQSALDNGNVKKSDISKITSSIDEIKELGKGLNNTDLSKSVKSLIEDSVTQLNSLKNANKLDDVGKETLNILNEIKKVDKIDVKTAKKAIDAMDKASDVLELTAELKTAGTAIIKHSDDVAKVTSSISKLISNKNITKSISAIGKIAGGTAIAASVCAFVFELALTYVLQRSIYNWIENLMSSFNVLTVYPLRKRGTAHVAGIDGHKGLVVGSPTWNQEGPIGNFINWVFKDRDSFVYDAFKAMFFSDKMVQIAETYKKDNLLGDYTDASESSISGLLKSIAESQASNYSNYRAMIFNERITSAKSPEAQYTYKKTRIVEDSLEDIVSNNVIRDELVPITPDNSVLEPYFTSQVLKIAHDQSLGDADKIPSFNFNNVASTSGAIYTCGIKLTDTTVDLPFLRPDAFQVFNKIVESIVSKSNMKKYGEGEKITIWFKSGTIVNDRSWASTGYMFRFEVTNYSSTHVEEVLTELSKEIKEIFANSDIKESYNIFNYRKLSNSDAYEVFVSPRNEYIKLQLD